MWFISGGPIFSVSGVDGDGHDDEVDDMVDDNLYDADDSLD
jgi:hypothetical protein